MFYLFILSGSHLTLLFYANHMHLHTTLEKYMVSWFWDRAYSFNGNNLFNLPTQGHFQPCSELVFPTDCGFIAIDISADQCYLIVSY